MKKAVSIIFLLIILIQPLNRLLIYISFRINQEYIANNLCVNRLDKITVCYGSCQLTKKIEEQEQKEQQFPTSAMRDYNLFCKPNLEPIVPQISFRPQVYKSYYHRLIHEDFPSGVFHPPKAA
ncbi:MAG: hypothetical protein ACNS62_22425 [Candidatus Cyclobacteriaceae bacterium M3_2C_046]